MLAELLEEEEMASSLPEAARAMFRLMLDTLAGLGSKIADLDKEIARRAREDEVSRRLMTVPGIGPMSATAMPRRPRPLPKAATSPLASVSRLFKDRQAVSRSSGQHPKWANVRLWRLTMCSVPYRRRLPRIMCPSRF
jgi:transposase